MIPPDAITQPTIPDHQLLRRIGDGSYGEVWLARNVFGELRAVKVVWRRSFGGDEQPFLRELQGIRAYEPVSRLHPSQLAILHVGQADDASYFYYVMELADAAVPLSPDQIYSPRTLRSELDKRGYVPAAECRELAHSLATAMAHLHGNGLIHRDIKPANIIFVGGLPKLADIGLVTAANDACSVVGTEGYMPPEGPGTPMADLFSLGRVLYEAATGLHRRQYPQLPPDLRTRPDAAELVEFNEIVLKLGAVDIRDRYQSAPELLADVALLEAGRSVKRLRWLERQVAWGKRMAAGGVVLTALLAAGWWVQRGQVRLTREHAEEMRRNLYAADIRTAHIAIQDGKRLRPRRLLHQYLPKEGESEMRGFEWRFLWGLLESDRADTVFPLGKPVISTAWSPDGKLVVLGDETQQVSLWEFATGKRLLNLTNPGPVLGANWVRFSLDGQWLVAAGAESVRVWQTIGWSLAASFPTTQVRGQFDERFYNLAVFSSDGKRLAFRPADNPHMVSIVSTESWSQLAAINGNLAENWRFLEWVPGSRYLILGGRDWVQVWDAETGLKRTEWSEPFLVDALAVSPDGSAVALGGLAENLRIRDLPNGEFRIAFKSPSHFVRSLAFSADGQLLAAGGDAITVYRSGESESLGVLDIHEGKCVGLAFNPDGTHLVSGGLTDGSARISDLSRSKNDDRLVGAYWPVGFFPDGKLMTYSPERHLQTWELSPPTLLETVRLPKDHTAFFQGSPVLSTDGKALAFCLADGSIEIWDWPARTRRRHVSRTNALPEAWTLAPDASFTVAIADHQLTLCRLATGEQTSLFTDCAFPLSVSPDSRIVACATTNSSVRFLEVLTQRSWESQGRWITPAIGSGFSPDSRAFGISGIEFCMLFDVATGTRLMDQKLENSFRGPAFSPDGKTIAIVSSEGTLHLWHTATQREMLRLHLPQRNSFRRPIMFSPDGTILAVGAGLDGGPSARFDTLEQSRARWNNSLRSTNTPAVWLWRAPLVPDVE